MTITRTWLNLSFLASGLIFLVLLLPNQAGAAPTGEPQSDARPCPSHNPNEWHGLYNAARNCHYDHEHKDNPGIILAGMTPEEVREAQKVRDIFGPPGAWFGGRSLSYPWQTFHGAGPTYAAGPANPQMYENGRKHEGYGWIVRTDFQPRGGQYIKDFRYQYHAIFASPGAVTRFHSFSLEANICKINQGCRVIRTGGWLDLGHLRVNGHVVKLPNQEGDGARQRLHATYRHGSGDYARQDGFRTAAVWYGLFTHPDHVKNAWRYNDTGKPFRKLAISIETQDAWAEIDVQNPTKHTFFCPAFDCNKNGSTVKMHRLTIDINEPTFNGYTDRFGLPSETCYSVSLDCIPTRVDAWPHFYANGRDRGQMRDYDVSPEGLRWIKYPN